MEKQYIRTVKTKLNEDDKNPKITVLTFLTAGLTAEMLIEPALQTLVINKQGQYRRAKAIPQKEEVNLAEMIAQMGKRAQIPATVDGLAAVAITFDASQRAALIKKLQDDEKAAAALAKGKKKDGESRVGAD